MGTEPASEPFQVCGACRRAWRSWREFVEDAAVRLRGLQANAAQPEYNLMVFEHSCGSSVSILTRRLRHLLPQAEAEPALPLLFGAEHCRGHCRFLEDLEACDAPCSNARDRALILLIRDWKRGGMKGRGQSQ